MINPMSMYDKTVIVTGAASGIGRETAVLLYKLGANLLLLDIDESGLNSLEKELENSNNKIVCAVVDLNDFELVKKIIIDSREKLNSVYTGLVHCAGIPSISPLRTISNDHYEKVMRINSQAGLNLAKIFAGKKGHDMSKQGSIVFISSVYGLVGSSANVAYAMSKAAIVGMTKSLAIELANKKIRVNCVAPGFIKTNMADNVNLLFDNNYADIIERMHPLGWGEALDIANAVVFLLSDASKWTTGAVFNIDGGYTAQ